MGLIKEGKLVDDPFVSVAEHDKISADGPVIVSMDHWLARREDLLQRDDLIGVRLKSDQHPDAIAGDLEHFSLVALEFPFFRDG
ncbi:MAG: DUF934 domain-containing protein, partial [Gammaproteobacteria bacterium]